jgi:hypothetical protein
MIANIVWLSLAKAAEYLDVSKDTVLRRAVEWTDEPVPGNAPSLKDTQGLYLPPRDFNSGAFRGGHTGRDLFTRISVGLAGTSMVDFDNKVMTDQQRWSVVHFGFTGELNKDDLEDITVSTPSLAASNVLDASGQLVAPKNFKIHGIRQTRRPAPGNACA